MIKKVILFVFLLFIFNKNIAQPIVGQPNTKDLILSLPQSEIEQMEPGDGYLVFNTTSGCLNYYFSKKWFEVCGNCIPKPQLPDIDTITQVNNLLEIKFKPIPKSEISFQIATTNKWIFAQDSIISIPIPNNLSSVELIIKTTNTCGAIDTSIDLKIKALVIGKIENIKINQKDISTRKIGSTRWMCQDYLPPTIQAIKEQPSFFTIADEKNTCPSGWSVPSQKDWEQLLSNYTNNYQELFLKPEDKNASIGLGNKGLYSVEEKKFYAPDAAYYWMKGKNEDKQNLLSITKNGFQFLSEKAEKAAMPLRCVQYE